VSESFLSLSAENITLMSFAWGALVAVIVGIAAGAIGGIIVGGKHLGNELAAMMGAFFGPMATLPGVLLGLLVLKLI
tara:strand:+ start:689 stop:919 length:231 start_codon:yes stop_codon:yes gene_type:complete